MATTLSQDKTDILKCGYMRKQGKMMSSWKERYFILQTNSTLKYYQYKTDREPRGVIDLSLITNIIKTKSKRIDLITPQRTWKLKLKSIYGRDSWFQQIYIVWKNTQYQQENTNHNNKCNGYKKELDRLSNNTIPPTLSSTGFMFHKIVDGETLTDLSIKYGISQHKIKQYNKDIIFGHRFNHHIDGKLILIPIINKEREKAKEAQIEILEEFKFDINLSDAPLYLENDKNLNIDDDDDDKWWNTETPKIYKPTKPKPKPKECDTLPKSARFNRVSFIMKRFNKKQKNEDIEKNNNENTSDSEQKYDEWTAESLLKLLNGDNPDKYLYFIYRKLRKLTKERDESIIDKLLETVILKLEIYIHSNITDILYLMMNNNDKILIEILKICESEDRAKTDNKILTYSYKEWSEWRKMKENDKEINIRNFAVPKYTEIKNTMKEKLLSEILDCIIIKIRKFEKEKCIKDLFKTIDDNMKDIDDINNNNNNIDIEFPANYDILNFYVTHYYKLLIPVIMDKLKNTKIELQDTLFIVSFIERFKLKIDFIKNIETIIKYLSDKQIKLMKVYIDASTEKWSLWVINIIQNESDKRDFFIINHVPRVHCVQDLFTALNHQFENIVNKYQLNEQFFIDIMRLILNTLDLFQILLKNYIDLNYMEFEDEYYCALINSIYDVVQKLINYDENINDYLQNELFNELSDDFDERISKFTRLGKQCTVKLSDKINRDTLEENIFTRLFTLEYFKNDKGSEIIIDSMILTIGEYVDDFNKWIEEKYFFIMFCKSLVNIIYNEYIKALIKNEPRTSKLIQFIRRDVKKMNNYFGDISIFTDLQFNKLWNEKYQYLDAIHFALDIEEEFFGAYAQILQKDECFGQILLEYIKKKRKIQKMDHVLTDKIGLGKLKHNKVAKKMGNFIQKTKEKKKKKKKKTKKQKKNSDILIIFKKEMKM